MDITKNCIQHTIDQEIENGNLKLRIKSDEIYIGEPSVSDRFVHPIINGIPKYCEQHFFYRSMSLKEANLWVTALKKRSFNNAIISNGFQGFSSNYGYSYEYLKKDNTVMLEFDAPQFIINILKLGVTGPKSEKGDMSWSIGGKESNSKQIGDFTIVDKNGQLTQIDFAGLDERLNDAYGEHLTNVLSHVNFVEMSRAERTRLLLPYVFFNCVSGVKIVACHRT